MTGTQPGVEVSKPREYSKAKEAFDCKTKLRTNASCWVGARLGLPARSLIQYDELPT